MQTRWFCSFTDTIRDFHRNNIYCVINFIKCCVCYGLYLLNIVLIKCCTCYMLYFLSPQHLLCAVFFEYSTCYTSYFLSLQYLLDIVFFEYSTCYASYFSSTVLIMRCICSIFYSTGYFVLFQLLLYTLYFVLYRLFSRFSLYFFNITVTVRYHNTASYYNIGGCYCMI